MIGLHAVLLVVKVISLVNGSVSHHPMLRNRSRLTIVSEKMLKYNRVTLRRAQVQMNCYSLEIKLLFTCRFVSHLQFTDFGVVGHHVQHSVVLASNNVTVRAFHPDRIVEIIRKNRGHVVKQIVNVLLVRIMNKLKETIVHVYSFRQIIGIKQTEPEKFPLKGYLSIREGDILCVPPNSTEMAKHMANLVRSIFA